MSEVRGPLIYAVWEEIGLGTGELELTLQIDFYCPKGYTCMLVNEKGENISGNKVAITQDSPKKKTPKAPFNAYVRVFFKIIEDLSSNNELETIIVQQNVDGKWKNYTVPGSPSLNEIYLEIYDWHHYNEQQPVPIIPIPPVVTLYHIPGHVVVIIGDGT